MSNDNLAGNAAPMRLPATGIKPLLLLVGLAAAVAAGVGIALWSQAPSYSLLFGNLSDADAGQVAQALNQAGVRYKIGSGNSMMVPSDQVNQLRLDLQAKGVPSSSDFTLLEKDPGFGVSQFRENALYQHALETELARTISSLKAVAGARVHLAVPQQSAFVRDRRPVSASVVLQLRGGDRLGREQIDAIVNLVASSIPELSADNVTVVDSAAHLLSAPELDSEFAAREQQLQMARSIEEDYSQSIIALLSPWLGGDRVHAKVVATLDAASVEQASEQYNPTGQVVRSEQTSEDTLRTGAGPQGVPGALSNQPPQGGTALPPGVAPAQTAEAGAATTPENSSRAATRNYEIDRTVAYTKTPAGRITRLTVAVVIDNLRSTDASGKVTETPLTPEQLASVTTLVRNAVGYDEARGDSVSVVNQSFLPVEMVVPEVEKTPIWQNPLVLDIVKVLAGLIVLALLLLFVIKPLVRGLVTASRTAFVPAAAGPQASIGEIAAPAAAARSGNTLAFEQQVAQARSIVAKDPARVAQVVKDWVQNDE